MLLPISAQLFHSPIPKRNFVVTNPSQSSLSLDNLPPLIRVYRKISTLLEILALLNLSTKRFSKSKSVMRLIVSRFRTIDPHVLGTLHPNHQFSREGLSLTGMKQKCCKYILYLIKGFFLVLLISLQFYVFTFIFSIFQNKL